MSVFVSYNFLSCTKAGMVLMRGDRIWPAMAAKHGFASKREFVEGAQKKFSLLENGILELQSTRLLPVNVS